MASNVSTVYIQVIDDVVGKVRDEFINSGSGEVVLNELQALWEMKMLQHGAISGNVERPPAPKQAAPGQITPFRDLNVPYEGQIEEYETPTSDMLFPPTPLQTTIPTPLPGTGDQGMYNIPTGQSDYTSSPFPDIRYGTDVKSGRNSPYMQSPSPWLSHRSLGVDVNVAYDEGRDVVDGGAPHWLMTKVFFTAQGKRKRDDYAPPVTSGSHMPQQDGSGDLIIEVLLPKGSQFKNSSGRLGKDAVLTETLSKEAGVNLLLPQLDGIHDEYDELFPFQGVAGEDYNSNTPVNHELRAPTPSVGTPKPSRGEAVDDDEPPLNEDDDDDDEDLDDFEQEEEEPQIQHLVLAQFDKVSRTKNRWKCTLKDGIMHLNRRDILFNKANGEFDF